MAVAGQPFIDVRELIRKYSIEELNRTADNYFRRHKTPEVVGRVLSKPFVIPEHTPRLLLSFGHMLQGLAPAPGMTILDFGSGPGWATRCLTQLGYKVIACDVSEAALNLARKGFELFPTQGKHQAPTFLLFDGRKIDLPDASVDRVFCLDAFHHVPNQQEVLYELARLLKPGGIAGFSEPGPTHSRSPLSQQEMRDFTVIENDIVLEDIWPMAQRAGFGDLQVGYFTPAPQLIAPKAYDAHVNDGLPLPSHCVPATRDQLRGLRLFFLYRYAGGGHTSREAGKLRAELHVEAPSAPPAAGAPVMLTVRARNVGDALWLRSGPLEGAVNLSVREESGLWKKRLTELARKALPASGVAPGEEVTVSVTMPGLAKGRHRLVIDLVSEHVCWFADQGSAPARLTLDVG
jgi:2-polyprenyl-3-methyl-5-hydroxy-6-metoxy-1,4-benzoquinol methylase